VVELRENWISDRISMYLNCAVVADHRSGVLFSRSPVVNLGPTALQAWRLAVMIAAFMTAAGTVLVSLFLFASGESAFALSSPGSSGPTLDFLALNCARLC